jgi:type I restriction enzyme S subunit
LTKKRQIKQGAMQELLAGKRRLPGFESKWGQKRFGELLSIRDGRSQKQVECDSGDYPILATGGQIGLANTYLHDKPSVLIGRKGTIDQPRYMDSPFWSVDTLFYSEVHSPNVAKFLYYRFCLIDWMRHNEASGVPSLGAKVIESIEISCPDAAEQQAIANMLSDMDADIAATEARLTKARDLKQAMAQALLTGRIRLGQGAAA